MIRNFLLNTVAIAIVFYLLPLSVEGVNYIEKGISILVISVIITGLNLTLRPILKIIAMPINIVTLGIFSIIINAIIIKVADVISPSFAIVMAWNYVLFALLLALVNVGLSIFKDRD